MTDAAAPLPDFDPTVVTELDVRAGIGAGEEVFGTISAAANGLPEGGVLHLRTPFQPLPLIGVLSRRGFIHHSEGFGDDDWSTWFWRAGSPPPAPHQSVTVPVPEGVLDLRQLPAPEPLVAIMARIARDDSPFDVMLPFDPDILSALLVRQGWQAERVAATADGARFRLRRMPSS